MAGNKSVALQRPVQLTGEQQEFLSKLNAAMPMDLSAYTRPEVSWDRTTPALEDIARSANLDATQAAQQLAELERALGLPPDFIHGDYDAQTARARRLARQYRQRVEPDGTVRTGDKTFLLMGELGLATRLTDPDIYKGLALVNVAYGFHDTLRGVIMQDAMPDIPQFWGVQRHDRMLLAGRRTPKPGEQGFGDEGARWDLEKLMHSEDLTEEDKAWVREEIAWTINNYDEAATLAAEQLAPLFATVPEQADIVMQYGPKDLFNIREMYKSFVEQVKQLDELEDRVAKMANLEDKIADLKRHYAHESLKQEVGEYVRSRLESKQLETARQLRGQDFQEFINDRVLKGKRFEQFSTRAQKAYLQRRNLDSSFEFGEVLAEAIKRYDHKIFSTDDLNTRINVDAREAKRRRDMVENAEGKLSVRRDLEAKIAHERKLNMAWFTHQYAMTPTDAKTINIIVKRKYANYYEKLKQELKEQLGREVDLNVIKRLKAVLELGAEVPLDKNKSVFTVANDEDLATFNTDDPDYRGWSTRGIKFALIPATNVNRSNEAVHGTHGHLQKIHAESLTRQVARGRKPEEFTGIASADVLVTSYGAGPWMLQQKLAVAEEFVDGVYRATPRLISYLKLGTMLSEEKLEKAAAHGNKDSIDVKRYTRGGHSSVATYLIFGADGTQHHREFDTQHLIKLGREFYPEYERLTAELGKAKNGERKQIQRQLDELLEKVRAPTYVAMKVADTHFGCVHTPGRPTNQQTTRASIIGLTDRIGIPNAIISTEMIHGAMVVRGWGYDSTIEWADKMPDIEDMEQHMSALRRAKLSGFMNEDQHDKMAALYARELAAVRGNPIIARQLKIFKDVYQPFSVEAMTKGAVQVFGSGNHVNSGGQIDEADTIRQAYSDAWARTGRLQFLRDSYGRQLGTGEIELPVGPGEEPVLCDVYHKMWSGDTEVDGWWRQAMGTKSPARFFSADDRHHGGFSIAAGRFLALGYGNQTVNGYVYQVGKTSSTRGSSYFLYSPVPGVYGGGCAIDNVVDPIINWQQEAAYLVAARQLIRQQDKEIGAMGLAREARQYAIAAQQEHEKSPALAGSLSIPELP